MRTFDLSPLLRSTVGFDRIDRLFEAATRMEDAAGYPPYNIEMYGEDKYRVTLAVAGFTDEDIEIVAQDRTLLISGKGKAETQPADVKFLHRGIARRAFQRRFELADNIQVVGAKLENGLLEIDLVREVPEALKPRKIKIASGEPATIEAKAA